MSQTAESTEVNVETFELVTLGDGKARESLLSKLQARLAAHGWSTSEIFGVQMAIEESVSNAYRHGNLEGELGNVTIRCQLSSADFSVEISDNGEGFDQSAVPDPLSPENLESQSGRGLLLIHGFMDDIEYQDGGRRVIMRKSR